MATESINIWLNDPSVLFKKGQINQLWPKEKMSQNEKINAITRLVIILTILGFLWSMTKNCLKWYEMGPGSSFSY